MTHSIHVKGFDSFTTSTYEEGVAYLRAALEEAGTVVTFQPSHVASREFPVTPTALKDYDVIILSDIGSNTLLLRPETFTTSKPHPNRLQAIADYVRGGGGLIMVGGYLSFQGFEAKARYRGTPVEDVLPVHLLEGDDRVEVPEGCPPRLLRSDHPIVRGLPEEWPPVLGYNRLQARDEADVLAGCFGDPLLAVRQVGAGRTAAFASDCGPHWAPLPFVEWNGYKRLWVQLVEWVAGVRE